MRFETFEVDGPVLIRPTKIGDSRGWFSEIFRLEKFVEKVGSADFVQHNQSMSGAIGTVRGLHFQIEPRAQGKLVRCLKGEILDIAVDIRRSSSTFGSYVSAILAPNSGDQLWVPPGFAHGFVTRAENTEVFYLVTDYYSPAHDRGLLWNDPHLAIDWGVEHSEAILSDKDGKWPTLDQLSEAFA